MAMTGGRFLANWGHQRRGEQRRSLAARTQPMASVLLATVLVLLAIALATAADATAATTIGFDNLAAGELVTNQYESEGLNLGFTKEFPAFATKIEDGDCGPPAVAAGSGELPAVSPPNYATLEVCKGGPASGPPQYYRGTFGALVGRPAKSLAVDIRGLTPGIAQHVKLTTYNSAGVELQNYEGEATHTEWTRLAVTLADAAQISYFSIATANSTASPANSPGLGIDNLSFETASEGKKEEENNEKPPPKEEPKKTVPPTPPTATLAVSTPNPVAGEAVALSGAGSQAGSGHIISYAWDFNDDGKIDTSTGTSPTAHFIFAPGTHTVGLTVTNSLGEKAHTALNVHIEIGGATSAPGGEGGCQPTLTVGDAHIVADCIEKLAGGSGYVISTRQILINGMVLSPRATEGFYATFKIKTVPDYIIAGTATQLSGPPVSVELPNTPIGDMVLGGRNLESEPIDLETHSNLNETFFLYHGLGSPHARAAGVSKTLLMAFGVGEKCEGGKKGASCCPSGPGTSCATLPGNFPLTGQVDVYVNSKGQALFDVQVGLSLKEVHFEATGALEISASLETGIELQSLKFEIGEASLAPIFKVKKTSFEYYFPEYYEESKRDSWQAKGTITFGENIAELEAELAFKHGEFQSAGMKFKANPGVPIYAGIFLNEIGASVGVHPLTFGGSLGASIAEVLELELEFKYREATKTELGFFGGKGTLSLKNQKIATLAADVYSDGYTDAELNIKLQVPFPPEEAFASVEGQIGFWDEPATGKWEAYGRVAGKIWIIEAEIAGLINNHYVAGCGDIHVIVTVSGYGFYSFENGETGFEGFVNNCKERLAPYKEHPAVKHSGGFVGGESLATLPGTPHAALAGEGNTLSHVAAGGEGETVKLAGAPRGEDLRITSSSGSPIVTLVGPSGQTFTTPATIGHPASDGSQFVAVLGPSPNQVLVFLKKPQGGNWRIEPAAGSGPIAKVEGAGVLPPPAIHAHAQRHGKRWALAYTIGHYTSGLKLQLRERGRDSDHLLATVGAARGVVPFVPQEALSQPRQILATVLSARGVPLETLTVGHYTAPRAFHPGRPRGVRIVRRGTGALVSWSPVAGARSYRIRVTGSDGRLETHFRKPTDRSVSIPNVLGFERFTATVTAVGGKDQLPGPAAHARLAAVKPPKQPTRHGRHRHRHR